jgi:limonene-1,2-epoxide hydrolase
MAVTARTDDERTVLEFMAAWEDGDVDRLMSYFQPDARFLNAANPGMPIPPREGHAAIREYLERLYATRGMRLEVRGIASDDAGSVFAERVDWVRSLKDGGESFGIPIVGVLQLRDGKIAEWREYFDTRVIEDGLGIKLERQEV